jgi:hypothetical protein
VSGPYQTIRDLEEGATVKPLADRGAQEAS